MKGSMNDGLDESRGSENELSLFVEGDSDVFQKFLSSVVNDDPSKSPSWNNV